MVALETLQFLFIQSMSPEQAENSPELKNIQEMLEIFSEDKFKK